MLPRRASPQAILGATKHQLFVRHVTSARPPPSGTNGFPISYDAVQQGPWFPLVANSGVNSEHFAAITTNTMKTLLDTRILRTNLRLMAMAAAATLIAMAVLPVPVRGDQTKSFCESGSAVALQF